MTVEQILGLGALMAIGAIVVGYVVSCLVPRQHFPRTAGVLASNAIIAGLTAAGIDPASGIFLLFALFSIWPLVHALGVDFEQRKRG